MPGLSCRILLYMLYSTIHDANDWCGHDRLCCGSFGKVGGCINMMLNDRDSIA